MDMKNLSLPSALSNAAQNIKIDISLKDWPATVAVCAVCCAIVGVAAVKASKKRKDDKPSKKKKTHTDNKSECSNTSAEGSSE